MRDFSSSFRFFFSLRALRCNLNDGVIKGKEIFSNYDRWFILVFRLSHVIIFHLNCLRGRSQMTPSHTEEGCLAKHEFFFKKFGLF